MEKSNKVERSEVWHNIYEVLARLDLKEAEGDCLDRPSAATEIEQTVKKLLLIHNVSHRRELLAAFQRDYNKRNFEDSQIADQDIELFLAANGG